MKLTESQLREIIRLIILESNQEEIEDSEETDEEPMGDESKMKAAYGIAKEVSSFI